MAAFSHRLIIGRCRYAILVPQMAERNIQPHAGKNLVALRVLVSAFGFFQEPAPRRFHRVAVIELQDVGNQLPVENVRDKETRRIQPVAFELRFDSAKALPAAPACQRVAGHRLAQDQQTHIGIGAVEQISLRRAVAAACRFFQFQACAFRETPPSRRCPCFATCCRRR